MFDLRTQERRLLALPDSAGSAYGEVLLSPDGRTLVTGAVRRSTDWGEVWTTRSGQLPLGAGARPVRRVVSHRLARRRVAVPPESPCPSTDHGPLRWELWRMRGVADGPRSWRGCPKGATSSQSPPTARARFASTIVQNRTCTWPQTSIRQHPDFARAGRGHGISVTTVPHDKRPGLHMKEDRGFVFFPSGASHVDLRWTLFRLYLLTHQTCSGLRDSGTNTVYLVRSARGTRRVFTTNPGPEAT